jgi:hypothetical protein
MSTGSRTERSLSKGKKTQEISKQKANHKIEELEKAKQHFEQEIHINRNAVRNEGFGCKADFRRPNKISGNLRN